jgi:outer membrane protein OmpA-like peptidoglycan-associated protein
VPPGAPAQASAPRVTLQSEQLRLAELFRGTPVVFAMQPDGTLRSTVPRRFSFDTGASKVKPPLAAVLDRLAKSQLQTAASMRVAAPSDPDARSTTLARDRAQSMRDYLVTQGISTARLRWSGTAQTEQVEVVISEAGY